MRRLFGRGIGGQRRGGAMDKDNTKGFVKSCIETYCCRSSLGHIHTHEIEMESPYNERRQCLNETPYTTK